jgi:hypothetical protein
VINAAKFFSIELGEILRTRYGGENCVACGVVDRDAQVQRRAVGRCALGAADLARQARRDAVAAADHAEAHVVAHEVVELVTEIEAQQLHQTHDFGRRPSPVVAGKRIERQRADALLRRRLDHAAQCFDTGDVALMPRQPPGDSPAAIAVHDDADVQFRVAISARPAVDCL